ncbi:DNA polymerase domain-containing protein [Leptospira sp. 96542]|nr:DNA polymerase domain-containing protein [Leptospira sp. 96542]
MPNFRGYLFDIYHTENKIFLWVKSEDGETKLFYDHHHPIIYIRADTDIYKRLVKRFYELDALLEIPKIEQKRLFYENKFVSVLKLVISKPSLLPKITNNLFKLYGKYDIYHSDVEVTTSYMIEKEIFPLVDLTIEYEKTGIENKVLNSNTHSKISDLEYSIPEFNFLSLELEKSHRIPIIDNNLLIKTKSETYKLPGKDPIQLIHSLNQILKIEDPDIILSSYGDQVIFPFLFLVSQKNKIKNELDRDKISTIKRVIKTEGTSFNTYGTIVYRAPSYPLFGRWHIDSKNSFVFKESDLFGIIELSRISRLPIQKMTRASTGKALTYIEVDVALKLKYLVPWQKSAVESPKTALELLISDRGGLVFQPDISSGISMENVAQLDFAQMYPTIMVLHNISPETVNCLCCVDDPEVPLVPRLGYRICNKRKGIVSEALAHVLERRSHYKKKKKETEGIEYESYNQKQASLKWMLVTSFGYLGYRNAKFGKLESHEAVSAFGRDKILTAKEIAEDHGYDLVHAITDSIFIKKSNNEKISEEELKNLCLEIQNKTLIKMEIEGIYSWLVFPTSTRDNKMPVANRYMGKFTTGEFKSRAIVSRRKDVPIYIKKAQLKMLEWMQKFDSLELLKSNEKKILDIHSFFDTKIKNEEVPWEELLIQKSTSQDPEDYQVDGATSLSLKELTEMGIQVQAGEKIRYLVVKQKSKSKDKRYKTEESIQKQKNNKIIQYDVEYYRKLLLSSFKEIWMGFASFESFEDLISNEQKLPF